MAKNYLTKCLISTANKEIPLVLLPMCVIFSTENTLNLLNTKSKACVIVRFSEALLTNSLKGKNHTTDTKLFIWQPMVSEMSYSPE